MEDEMYSFSAYAPLIVMALLFYFMLYRPNKKAREKHDAMVESLVRGKKVVTNGGIIGTIFAIKEYTILLEVSQGVNIEIAKNMIAGEYAGIIPEEQDNNISGNEANSSENQNKKED